MTMVYMIYKLKSDNHSEMIWQIEGNLQCACNSQLKNQRPRCNGDVSFEKFYQTTFQCRIHCERSRQLKLRSFKSNHSVEVLVAKIKFCMASKAS